jgi:hypothetical protein
MPKHDIQLHLERFERYEGKFKLCGNRKENRRRITSGHWNVFVRLHVCVYLNNLFRNKQISTKTKSARSREEKHFVLV